MSVLRVQTLGDLRLVRDDGESVALRRKPLALLAYLTRRAPRPASRAELSALFWSDRSEERARQSLRQALLEVKQAVGGALEVSADAVRLADGAVALDVADFESDAKQGRLEEAAARWTGEFLPGAEDLGGEELERWVEGERAALHRRLGAVMQQLIGAAELRADWHAAAAWAQRWAEAAPFDERAHARLVEALRMEGRASDALERHADFASRLRTTLEVEPSQEFQRLAGGLEEQARSEVARRLRPSAAVRAPALVGRGHVLAELAAACRAAADGSPAVVLMEDGGGCGKTRICDELVKQVGADALVLRARGTDGDPYATARELFAGLRDAPGSAGAAPEALAEVARLVPSLAAQFKHLPAPSGDEVALRDAVVQVLAAVSEELPVLVVLDDAHEADDASQQLAASTATRLAGRVTMIFCADKRARRPRSALDTLLAAPGILRVKLGRVAVHDVEAMLASMITIPEDQRATLAARLHAETLGVPLFVYELVTTLVDERLLTLDAAGEWRVSPTLEGRPLPLPVGIRERVAVGLARLSPPARSIVDAAAVLGTPVEGVLLEAVANLTPAEAAAALRELAGRHMLLEEAAQTGRFEFAHPVIGRVAYVLLSPRERQALHARAVDEMSAREMTTTAERSTLPYHLARAGPAARSSVAGNGAAGMAAASPASAARRWWPNRRRAVWGAAALLGVSAATAGATRAAGWWGAPASGHAVEARRVVVGAFQNRSGRPELDGVRDIAVDWIVRGLDETGLVEIVGIRPGPDGQRSATNRLVTDQALREAARAAHAGTIVTGTLHQLGDSVELEAIILDARDGTLLRALPAVRASAADPLPGVDRLRGLVIGALAALVDPAYDAGGAGARPPPSYEAYLAFMRGEEAVERRDAERAIAEYARAAAADSAYTLPLLRLAYVSYGFGRCDRVDSIAAVLEHRTAQLSRTDGYYLERVRASCRGDWESAHTAAARMADLAPRSLFAQFEAAKSAAYANRPREALRRLRMIDSADRRMLSGNRYWLFYVISAHMAGEEGELRRASRRLPALSRDFFTIGARAYAAGALGRVDDLERAAAEMIALSAASRSQDIYLVMPGLDELRVHGDAAEARALNARLAARLGATVRPGPAGDTTRFMQAELLYRAERWKEARDLAETLVPRHRDLYLVMALRGRAAARTGDVEGARRASDELAQLTDPSLRGSNIYFRAQIAAILGQRQEALRLLHEALAHGLSYGFEQDLGFIGHADMDLESIRDEPAFQALLKLKG